MPFLYQPQLPHHALSLSFSLFPVPFFLSSSSCSLRIHFVGCQPNPLFPVLILASLRTFIPITRLGSCFLEKKTKVSMTSEETNGLDRPTLVALFVGKRKVGVRWLYAYVASIFKKNPHLKKKSVQKGIKAKRGFSLPSPSRLVASSSSSSSGVSSLLLVAVPVPVGQTEKLLDVSNGICIPGVLVGGGERKGKEEASSASEIGLRRKGEERGRKGDELWRSRPV